MANDITQFEQSSVPAFIRNMGADTNNDLTQHASTSYPIMSIKGKVFTVVKDGVRMVVPNPKDPESPAHAIEVSIIKVNPNTSKVYYMQAFKEGEENVKPTCFSSDGKVPDPSSQAPQCKTCAACPHNVFGSARNPDGSFGRGKACSDSVRIAIADLSNLHEPMMLRVPPASIKALGEYGRVLDRRHVPYQAVVTRISFVQSEATPKLQFTPAGYVTEQMYREIVEEAKGDTVRTILTGSTQGSETTAEVKQAEAEEEVIPNKVYTASGVVQQAQTPAPYSAVAPAPQQTPQQTMQTAVDNVIGDTKKAYDRYVERGGEAAPSTSNSMDTQTVASNAELDEAIENLGFE